MAIIKTETQGRVAIIRLDRPEALNALNRAAAEEIAAAAEGFDRDPEIGCIVVTGADKAFAAGPTSRKCRQPISAT